MSLYVPHMNSVWSTVCPGAWLYIHFTLLIWAPKKYAYHITHVCPTALIQYSKCRPQLLHIQVTKTATFIYYAITMYVTTTNIPPKCHIYKPHMPITICAHETTMTVYVPHMNSVQSIMWTKALMYIYISHYWHMSHEQICLPHYTYMFYYTSSAVCI